MSITEDSPDNHDPKQIVGTIVAKKYKVIHHLDSGGFGEVYEAYNLNLVEQRVVIKFLKHVHSRDRFAKEASILCQLEHPNICRIIDYLPDDYALVMQFISGRDLESELRDHGPIDFATFQSVYRALCGAMKYAHSKRIAHRDIKPKNVMIDRNRNVYVIDFGIAKELDATALTKTGQMVLTPQYAAPERLNPLTPYDPFLSDIYEIGATLLKLVTGLSPFERIHLPDTESVKRLRWSKLAGKLKRVLDKATRQHPDDRYQTIEALERDLDNVTEFEPGHWRKTVGISIGVIGLLLIPVFSKSIRGNLFLEAFKIGRSFETSVSEVHQKESISLPQESIPPPKETDLVVAEPETLKPALIPLAPDINEAQKQQSSVPSSLNLSVGLIPDYNVQLRVDSLPVGNGQVVKVSQGKHVVQIVQFEYPVFVDTVYVEASSNLRYDLTEIYANRPRKAILLGCYPGLEGDCLTIELNNRSMERCSFPAGGISLLAGSWRLRVRSPNANLAVDSLVVFPYASEQLRASYPGGSAILDLADPALKNLDRIDIVVYWSRQ